MVKVFLWFFTVSVSVYSFYECFFSEGNNSAYFIANDCCSIFRKKSIEKCENQRDFISDSFSQEESKRALKIVCEIIRNPESMGAVWMRRDSGSVENIYSNINKFSIIRKMKIVGMRKIATSKSDGAPFLVMVTFCEKKSKTDLTTKIDCSIRRPSAILELVFNSKWKIIDFNLSTDINFHYDNF